MLVINNTKVLPARLFAHTEHGGKVEVLLLRRISALRWEVLVKPGKKCRPGTKLTVDDKLSLTVAPVTDSGERVVDFECDGVFEEALARVGTMPLPPYIHEKLKDQNRYQTVYARTDGSAAAPTAGLHFTPQLLEEIKGMGVEIAQILLHVGLGTFRPVKEEAITDHKMHSEYYEVGAEAAEIISARQARRPPRDSGGHNFRAHLRERRAGGRNHTALPRRHFDIHISALQVQVRGLSDNQFPPARKHAHNAGCGNGGARKNTQPLQSCRKGKVPLFLLRRRNVHKIKNIPRGAMILPYAAVFNGPPL